MDNDQAMDLWHSLNKHLTGLEKLKYWCERTEIESGLRQWVSFLPDQDQYILHMPGISTHAMQYWLALRMIRDNGVAVMSYRLQNEK